uniref:Uncharacterized protein n=1 Tax=Eucampia antarctica TaxID=49252 RepID=A0A7S2WLI6_9STRA|mmetsp:Transcript_5143/g.4820  ORF Transcript_5143/g.4820 Transcript_5143/m.4820 type:complete len:114 (+) Transcript_5143:759-1100(+)
MDTRSDEKSCRTELLSYCRMVDDPAQASISFYDGHLLLCPKLTICNFLHLFSHLLSYLKKTKQQGWCGLMIHTQPFFIKGIDDAVKARSSALGAMAMFLFTLCASLYGMTYDT